MKHYIDNSNKFVGTYDGEHGLDLSGLTEVPIPPNNAKMVWSGTEWLTTKAENDAEITAKANEIIYSKYPQIAQNKMSSQGLKLTLKIAQGGTLTTGVGSEQELLDSILTVDAWITAVRTVENNAIANGTILADVVWGV